MSLLIKLEMYKQFKFNNLPIVIFKFIQVVEVKYVCNVEDKIKTIEWIPHGSKIRLQVYIWWKRNTWWCANCSSTSLSNR